MQGTGSVGWYLQPAGPFGEWEQWCAARDAREDQLVSLRYVSPDMTGYEDLDANGTWMVMAGYGPVWAPRTVPIGWAPYKYGHWAWVAPWGWTWVDDAPWGFAPFHYGRWAFVGGRWVWAPGTVVARPVYAPALVVFVGAGPEGDPNAGGVGWFPLGPREVYVPPYGASPTYVQRVNVMQVNNITITTIEQTNVTQVTYVNRTAPYAMTVVPRQSFVMGQPVQRSAIVFNTNQARTAPIIGMGATVAPQRESIIGQPYVVNNPARQPPPQVMNRPVYGRITPAPPPAAFVPPQQPMAPVTVYRQPPPQAVAPVGPPVRQQRPIIINPRGPGLQPQPQGGFQPQPVPQPQPQQRPGFAPQPIPQPAQPQQRPGFQPQPIPQPQPQQRPEFAPQPVPQPAQPQQRPGFQPQPIPQPQPQQRPGFAPQPVPQPAQPQQRPGFQPQPPQGPRGEPQQGPRVEPPQGPRGEPQPGNQGPPATPQPAPAGPAQGSRPEQQGAKDNQGRGQAQSLLNELKNKTLPGVQGRLESAHRSPGAKLDYGSLSSRVNSASSRLSSLQAGLNDANADQTLQEAQSIQSELSQLDQEISQAMQSGGDQPGGPPGQQRQGGNR